VVQNDNLILELHSCRTVVFATGINQFYLPTFNKKRKTMKKLLSTNLILKYPTLDFYNKTYLNQMFHKQNVLIIGTGDSAKETSKELLPFAKSITLTS
jgi:thioredoxin reductase